MEPSNTRNTENIIGDVNNDDIKTEDITLGDIRHTDSDPEASADVRGAS